ncbi:MAG: peptidoglycan-binding protein [Pseudomonadota bacterium]
MVLALALLPGAGNFIGGAIAEVVETSPERLNQALHAAAGIVLAIVAVELLPDAYEALSGWWIALAFALGGITFVALEALVSGVSRTAGGVGSGARTSALMIYFAFALDLAADGLMIGSGSAVSLSLAVALAAGLVAADLPAGYATIANLKAQNTPRRQRLMIALSFFVYVVGAALLSFYLLSGASDGLKAGALVFVAGLLTVAAVEDMMEAAHDASEDNKVSVLAFVGGFALFTAVSAGLASAL